MKQLIVDYLPFEIQANQINESMKENNGKLVVKGILQRADTKNQNGRVYPKEILVREAKKYSQNFDLWVSEISWYVNECLNVSTTHAQTVLTCTGHSSCVNGSCETSTDSAHPFMYPYIKSEGYQYGVAPSGCDLIDWVKTNKKKHNNIIFFLYSL